MVHAYLAADLLRQALRQGGDHPTLDPIILQGRIRQEEQQRNHPQNGQQYVRQLFHANIIMQR